jgi:hypothetical protein
MEYYKYFELFLNIEDDLLAYIRQLEYSNKSRNIYSPRLSLLLLQTCPVIESYMVRVATQSEIVQNHEIYNWEYSWKIWDSNKDEIKEKDGVRGIATFPKFAYVCEKVFHLSEKSTKFYFSDKFQNISDNASTQQFKPFESLEKFQDFKNFELKDSKPKKFPVGLDTPKWWTAYNKIKHSFGDEAQQRVTYEKIIEGLAGLFLVLVCCDADYGVLKDNGYMSGKDLIKTQLFEAEISITQSES